MIEYFEEKFFMYVTKHFFFDHVSREGRITSGKWSKKEEMEVGPSLCLPIPTTTHSWTPHNSGQEIPNWQT
ncbi:hypothetical protein MTR_2g014180 [Medicago truncatula]|uniref:Uncharacterized protein n=1 Tax=Medicago truncatula TaxID=3880 RepID=G7ISD3_MEDTR|nr:hypothetical protein MTR_2g014180 [Medicago truncatula]